MSAQRPGSTLRALRGAGRLRWGDILVLTAGALGAWGLKAFYAEAGADELRFVLAPTAVLTEALSGARFEWEAGAGYLSREPAYLIAPSCAGLNFTIAAFASMLLAFTTRFWSASERAVWLVAAALVAFAATPAANAVRIALDLALREEATPFALARADLHRILGVAVYLGALFSLHAGVARALDVRPTLQRALAIGLAAYLAVAIGIPLLHGAAGRPGFGRHAVIVLATAVTLSAGALVISLFATRARATPPIRASRPSTTGA